MKGPEAKHHTRSMSKVIYTIKIAMLQHQLKNDIPECLIMKIVDLAKFLCLYHVKPWSRATLSFQAPIENLNLYKMLLTNVKEHKSEEFRQQSQAVVGKFETTFGIWQSVWSSFRFSAMLVFIKNKVWLKP